MLASLFRPRPSYLTCAGRDDGGGAQIIAQISVMALAKLRGLTYAHTPLSDVAHRPEDQSREAWAAAWEERFQLGHGEISAQALLDQGLSFRAIRRAHRFLPRPHTVHQLAHAHKVTNRHPEVLAKLAPELRERYLRTPTPPLRFDEGKIRVALHLRRGDVGASGLFSERFTETATVVERVRHLHRVFGRENLHLILFSQGKPEDFEPFTQLGAELQLDFPVFDTFHHFAACDVLLTAISTFSYLGGWIGGPVCFYEPFWHPPLPGWHSVDELKTLAPHVLRTEVESARARGFQ
ncbi:hypothetical protein HNR46_002898 [Haloferula luteola]|uniref:Uncharacterized protein n=1 Tax=Haloferula luteola TaxID=595692 RepID=A0A840VFQ7_9BACT|nr:hypothetical protein [Haloferula luteola]MBB5352650.1 hypothetical protein [Haloferula luteola]